MGDVSKRLRRRWSTDPKVVPTKVFERRPGEPLPGGVKDVQMLIEDGLDPVHAAYALAQQISSLFAEWVSEWSESSGFVNTVSSAQDEYMPLGPPMSPLTVSYFWTWALFDLRFGKSHETIAGCLIELNDLVKLDVHQLDAVRQLGDSRMGIYEHVGMKDGFVRLHELLTNEEFICHSSSGYLGNEGELWYVRLLPPLLPEVATYHVAFTTPYVLIGMTREDWTNFLRRTLLQFKLKNEEKALYRLMKYGPSKHYWHEFVLNAYHHHQDDAVFLTGIPDVQNSLPHAE